MPTTFNTIANVPTVVTFGPTSRCLTCGQSVAGLRVGGVMRDAFQVIDGVMHRRFDAAIRYCGCVTPSFWQPDDDWPDSRETIRAALRDHYLTQAYDQEQAGAPALAAALRQQAHLYDTVSDMALLSAYATHLAFQASLVTP